MHVRFWEGGARCFVERVLCGSQMVPETGAFMVDGSLGTFFSNRGTSDLLTRSTYYYG